ncbi:MAG TPA: amidohydrolase family protein, partial [Vicinamibacterales bacterium]|nr:amidohydrolase family protein [Vicinamibacterales bacterium]
MRPRNRIGSDCTKIGQSDPIRFSLVVVVAASIAVAAQQPPADLILTNGKIVTVDERFTIAQALAIRGDRIVAVGSNDRIAPLAGPSTRRIDLRGRTVIPGLIDNHLHLLRAGTTWRWEVRWDGIGSRREAIERLRARVRVAPAGEWIYTLGGWTIQQFADDPRPFTLEELDRIAPNHPVLLQASYYEAYVNSRALEALGLANAAGAPPWLERDARGEPTGRIAEAGVRVVAGRLPTASGAELEASTRQMIADLNRMGLTTVGSAGCEAD